ncbi:hypothetical protein WJR50_06210 [Catalinimonas sp. 4WD22]|uniref:hypothetical protein n=1 Tax=Catalinimonas locisalis TaxID=3133978 RepID=UPI003101AEE6
MQKEEYFGIIIQTGNKTDSILIDENFQFYCFQDPEEEVKKTINLYKTKFTDEKKLSIDDLCLVKFKFLKKESDKHEKFVVVIKVINNKDNKDNKESVLLTDFINVLKSLDILPGDPIARVKDLPDEKDTGKKKGKIYIPEYSNKDLFEFSGSDVDLSNGEINKEDSVYFDIDKLGRAKKVRKV